MTATSPSYENILAKAEEVIHKRFLVPYQEKLNQLLGDRVTTQNGANSSSIGTVTSTNSSLPPLQLKVNWTSIKELIQQHGLPIAENAIQILQEQSLYENMRKGIMRYISEDKLQRTIFNDQVDVICKLLTRM